jgi:hypothetical protein
MSNTFTEKQIEEEVPSYEAAIRSTESTRKQSAALVANRPLHEHLDQTRWRRIHSVLSTYIDPAITGQAASGLYRTVCLLIPSDVTSLQVRSGFESKEPELVGFPANEVVQLIRLEGEENNLLFWRQPAVIKGLETSLKERLALTGHVLEPEPELAEAKVIPAEPETPVSSPASAKKGFWQKTREKYLYQNATEAVIVDQKLGWRSQEEGYQDTSVPKGLVRVKVNWKEVCLRVENELGLYETRKGPGISLSIEVGG